MSARDGENAVIGRQRPSSRHSYARPGRTVLAPSRPSWQDLGRHCRPRPSDGTVENTAHTSRIPPILQRHGTSLTINIFERQALPPTSQHIMDAIRLDKEMAALVARMGDVSTGAALNSHYGGCRGHGRGGRFG